MSRWVTTAGKIRTQGSPPLQSYSEANRSDGAPEKKKKSNGKIEPRARPSFDEPYMVPPRAAYGGIAGRLVNDISAGRVEEARAACRYRVLAVSALFCATCDD